MALGMRADPYLAFNFLVEIHGLVVGGFREVSGLQVEVEIEDYREGGQNRYVHRLAGATRYPNNLVLKRGLMDARTLWDWQRKVTLGQIERKNGSIILLDSAGAEVWRWNFVDAYPLRWIGPELRSTGSDVALETLELVHCGLQTA